MALRGLASASFRTGTTPLRAVRPSRTRLCARADASVQDLLARDRKLPKVVPELAGDTPVEKVMNQFENGTKEVKVKSRKQRREGLVARTDRTEAAGSSGPKRCKEAIDKGLELFKEKKYQDAINMFNLALELPGNGAYRLPGSPREYSCPSDAEENAALYNMACAYAQIGERTAALTCLEAVLENGFEEYATLRSDPDLAPLRSGGALDQLVGKFDNPIAKLKRALPGSKKEDVPKPWLLW